MSNAPVRFGLVGFGAWGQHHADSIHKNDSAELVAISVNSDKSYEAAKTAYPNAEVFKGYEQMLAQCQLDCVDVVVPSHLHHEIGTAVLSTGHHLLMEKPMGISVAQCDDLLRLAKEKKRLLAIGHEFRLSSLWGKAKELIDEGEIGDPLYVLVELSRNPYRLGSDGWRYDIDRVGNWILEEPIHFFDLARWYLSSSGDPVSVYAQANSRQKDHPELQDNFSAIVNFPEGRYAVVSQTLAAFEHHLTVKITGTKGALWAAWSGAKDRTRHPTFSLRVFDGEELRTVQIDKITGELFELEDQVAMLVKAIRDGDSLSCTAEDGRWSVAMCLAAQASVESGTPVELTR
tara:strand:- start:89701 stop:90738 length:1038 start_codon:yes stop_codon:yes gene_type:complete